MLDSSKPGLTLLTGATGDVGGRLLGALVERGLRARRLTRPENLSSRILRGGRAKSPAVPCVPGLLGGE
ncbi:MAG: hypothetical protein HY900_13985 [Deltaproteobacteria bacterium]|nr:hypothetical protein [Deltaproteobacteria bacterium]